MFKIVHPIVWVFDCEWVPDPAAARQLAGLPATATAADGMEALWRRAGASAAEPAPYLKPLLCRVVSLAMVQRVAAPGDTVRLTLTWRPRAAEDFEARSEALIVQRFLEAVGRHKPQLVGYNANHADLRVLVQRALVHGLCLPGFCRRPDKPWEGFDYFSRNSEACVDLLEVLAGPGRAQPPALNELAALCGYPAKPEGGGATVARLWLDGRLAEIVERNLHGAVTTYLLWLRTALLAGFFDHAQHGAEEQRLRDLLAELALQGLDFAARYMAAWDACSADGNAAGADPAVRCRQPGVGF